MKKNKLIWIILLLFIILASMLVIYNKTSQTQTSQTDTDSTTSSNITEVTVGTQTIEKNLTSSGQIVSNSQETLSLNTSRYYNTMCVEENDFVSEGENILEYTNGTYLVAPYDLVVTKISIPAEGEKCTSLNGITVQNTTQMALSISIDETEIAEVAVGQEVVITPSAYEDKTYTGTVTKINQVGAYASNGSTFTGTVVFENDGNLKIGMSASCSITLEKADNVVAVPIEAIQTENNSKYVILKNSDGTTKNVTVETGISNDAYVEIKSGLIGGETIQMIKETDISSTKTNEKGMESGQMMGGPSSGDFMAGGSPMQGGNR